MTLARFKAKNHPQQVDAHGVVDDVDDRATHRMYFSEWAERWPFSIDVAAAAHNTKCERFYTRQQDGLAKSWRDEMVWCNPPYSDLAPWIRKAWAEQQQARGIVMLLPANRTEQPWWQHTVEPFRDRPGSVLTVEFLPGRMRFLRAGQTYVGPNERPPFGCVLLIWTPRANPDPELLYDPNRVTGGLFTAPTAQLAVPVVPSDGGGL